MYHIHTKFRVKSNSITTNYAQTNDGHGISYRDYNNNNSKNHPHTMHNTTTFCGRQCVQGEGDYTFCNILWWLFLILSTTINCFFFNISANSRLSNKPITHSDQQIMSRAFKISFNNRNTLYMLHICMNCPPATRSLLILLMLLLLVFSRCYWQHFVLCSGFFSCWIVFGYHFSSILFTYTTHTHIHNHWVLIDCIYWEQQLGLSITMQYHFINYSHVCMVENVNADR